MKADRSSLNVRLWFIGSWLYNSEYFNKIQNKFWANISIHTSFIYTINQAQTDSVIYLAIFSYSFTTMEFCTYSLYYANIDLPLSTSTCNFGSKGIFANKRHLYSVHIFYAPPLVAWNSSEEHLQWGQTYPLIFYITPIMGICVFTQKLSYFLTSASATYWGVVTMTAPSDGLHLIYCAIDRCSSEVPGGAI